MQFQKVGSVRTRLFSILATCLLASAIANEPAQAQTFKVLHTFHGKDGGSSAGQLVLDAAGNIYGTTVQGGSGRCQGFGCGTVFKMSKSGKILWSYSFKSYQDGYDPVAGVFRDVAGGLYGTTIVGGVLSCQGGLGCGTVFGLDKAGKKVLSYKFKGSPDGYTPQALLVGDTAGNLYGTTWLGGPFNDYGIVFKVDQAGKETILHSFEDSSDGCCPGPGLIWHAPHNSLYGVTAGGGTGQSGTMFRMSTKGKQTVLYNFGSDASPWSVLTFDSAGNLYGTTLGGGSNCGINSCGTVFKLSPNGGTWTQKTLYVFCQLPLCADGERPLSGPLVVDKAGNVYGTTLIGGASDNGVVFKLDPTGKESVVHNFTGGADGATPYAGLTTDSKGNLYGTAEIGGDLNCPVNKPHGCGVVFKITP